jgi:hypothetical protein
LIKLKTKEKHRRIQEQLEHKNLTFYPGKRFFLTPISTPVFAEDKSSMSIKSYSSSSSSSGSSSIPMTTNRLAILSPLLLQETQPLIQNSASKSFFSSLLSSIV